MMFPVGDIRINAIKNYLNHLHIRAAGIADGLLPQQRERIDSPLLLPFFAALQKFCIDNEFDISGLSRKNKEAFEEMLGGAVNRVSTLSAEVLAKEVFDQVFALSEKTRKEDKIIHETQSDRGEDYITSLSNNRAQGMMLDARALGVLAENVGLPGNVGFHAAQRMAGGNLTEADIILIREQLYGTQDSKLMNDQKPKDYVIVVKSMNNNHWYVTVYLKDGAGGIKSVAVKDSEFAMAGNTCGISAVIHGVQMIEGLVPGYKAPLRNGLGPRSSKDELSGWANDILLRAIESGLVTVKRGSTSPKPVSVASPAKPAATGVSPASPSKPATEVSTTVFPTKPAVSGASPAAPKASATSPKPSVVPSVIDSKNDEGIVNATLKSYDYKKKDEKVLNDNRVRADREKVKQLAEDLLKGIVKVKENYSDDEKKAHKIISEKCKDKLYCAQVDADEKMAKGLQDEEIREARSSFKPR